jgi:trk system potassium uptake protein
MRVVITGCGRVGAQLAEMLSLDGHEVALIDTDSASFQRLSKTFSGEAFEGIAFDEDTLLQAGIEEAQAFASVTNFDNTNLMTAEVVKHIFQVPKVIARLYNPDKEETFQALGMDYVCGTEIVAQALLEKILKPKVRVRSSCCNNILKVVEFDCPPRWAGKKIGWAEETMGLKVAFLERGGEAVLRDAETCFHKQDEITALISPRRLQRLERYLRNTGRR